jgi:hypothetical protein
MDTGDLLMAHVDQAERIEPGLWGVTRVEMESLVRQARAAGPGETREKEDSWFTHGSFKVLQRCEKLAQLDHVKAGPGHLLEALTRQRGGVASRALARVSGPRENARLLS